MFAFTKLRQWANQDDGQLYRIGNTKIGVVEAVGLLLFIAALVLWQLYAEVGVSSIWAFASAVVGLLLAILSARSSRDS